MQRRRRDPAARGGVALRSRASFAVVVASIVSMGSMGSMACGSSSSDASNPAPDAAEDGGDTASSGCAPGERLGGDGRCQAPGVPPSSCGTGFQPDARGGCAAIMPSDPCPAGRMAVPGDTACRDVAPCADGTWGDIPVEADTQYVDASFAGTSDGTSKAPWKTIGSAVAAANSHAIVAVAAGSYAESVVLGSKAGIGTKPIRLWGVCPSEVEIVGVASTFAAVSVERGASGSEIHRVALRGATNGMLVTGSTGVIADAIWIHDVAGYGVDLEPSYGTAELTLRASLVEHAVGLGIRVSGETITIDASVVRGTQPAADGTFGRGIQVVDASAHRGSLSITGSVVEGNMDHGIAIGGSDATIERTLVRDTAAATSEIFGNGIIAGDQGGFRSTLTLRTSVVERSHTVGVAVEGSDATIESTTVRDTLAEPSGGRFGRGIDVENDPVSGERANVTIHDTACESSFDAGVVVIGSDLVAEGLLVLDVKARAVDGLYGDGIAVFALLADASVNVSASRIEKAARAGLSSFGASVQLGASAFECDGLPLDGEHAAPRDPTFADLGGNACGCSGVSVVCQLLSNGLAAPETVPF
jgi:hypothetical protein